MSGHKGMHQNRQDTYYATPGQMGSPTRRLPGAEKNRTLQNGANKLNILKTYHFLNFLISFFWVVFLKREFGMISVNFSFFWVGKFEIYEIPISKSFLETPGWFGQLNRTSQRFRSAHFSGPMWTYIACIASFPHSLQRASQFKPIINDIPSLKLTVKAPENRPSQKETIVFQPSIFRGFGC